MKKLLLAAAITLTACNLLGVIAYAETCQGRGGARACGDRCVTTSDGECGCGGACTAAEMEWVAGAGKKQPVGGIRVY
jgi:hypothetical protein